MADHFHDLKFQRKRFIFLVSRNFGPLDQKKVLDALEFASRAHKGQRRDEGTAYIIHPIRVGIILLESVGTWDSDVVAAALLHDVVEDCGVRLRTIQVHFGRRVGHFVNALTRRKNGRETESEKEMHKRQKLAALAREPLEIRLIKCADILDNLRCAADVPWWSWTAIARRKFPRWRREFHLASEFAKGIHPLLYREMKNALRIFELKRIVRGVMRFGW